MIRTIIRGREMYSSLKKLLKKKEGTQRAALNMSKIAKTCQLYNQQSVIDIGGFVFLVMYPLSSCAVFHTHTSQLGLLTLYYTIVLFHCYILIMLTLSRHGPVSFINLISGFESLSLSDLEREREREREQHVLLCASLGVKQCTNSQGNESLPIFIFFLFCIFLQPSSLLYILRKRKFGRRIKQQYVSNQTAVY